MKTQTLNYRDGEVNCRGFLAYEKENAPVVLVAHAWRGQDDFARDRAKELAKHGYAGFAIDMYGDGTCVGNEEAPEKMAPFFLDRLNLQKRIGAAAKFAQSLDVVNGERIAAIGFCFGGLCVYELLRSGYPIDVAITFHGVFADELGGHKAKTVPLAQSISGKLLILHGNDDPMVSDDDLKRVREEMASAEVDWQIHIFGETMHAFTNPAANNPKVGTLYHERSSKRAFEMAYGLLSKLNS